jgi:hypothetical protein
VRPARGQVAEVKAMYAVTDLALARDVSLTLTSE